MQIKPQFLSRDAFLKAHPQLYYGTDEKWLGVMTEQGHVCALTLKGFPQSSLLLKSFRKHWLVEKDFTLVKSPSFLLAGTPFQHRVWQALLEIPLGSVLSYQDIANQLQMPLAVRAVGNAVGANPVSPLIPCHRVIGSRGHLGGYLWGLPAKVALLQQEGVDISRFKGLPL